MVYANPNGHDWGSSYNWDGLGISCVAFGVAYSLLFYTMCSIVWAYRDHPVVRIRRLGVSYIQLNARQTDSAAIMRTFPMEFSIPLTKD